MRLQNENTVKDVTPFLDQDKILNDAVREPYRSKLNMSEAYEQSHIRTEDVWKMAFATIYGTFVSCVMMMGDCNTPPTFQWLVTVIFRAIICHYVHVYLENTFVFSNMIEEHEEHLEEVFR
jgi:hypothetical protein